VPILRVGYSFGIFLELRINIGKFMEINFGNLMVKMRSSKDIKKTIRLLKSTIKLSQAEIIRNAQEIVLLEQEQASRKNETVDKSTKERIRENLSLVG
jgi:hypothetical protein